MHASTLLVAFWVVVVGGLLGALGSGHGEALAVDGGWLRLSIAFALVAFFGNVIVTPFSVALSLLHGQWSSPRSARALARMINWGDVAFTGPGMAALSWSAISLSHRSPALREGGAFGPSVAALAIAVAFWAFGLVPAQEKLLRLSERDYESGAWTTGEWKTWMKVWWVTGTVATTLPYVVLGVFVFRGID